jgi:hypothetical protein
VIRVAGILLFTLEKDAINPATAGLKKVAIALDGCLVGFSQEFGRLASGELVLMP